MSVKVLLINVMEFFLKKLIIALIKKNTMIINVIHHKQKLIKILKDHLFVLLILMTLKIVIVQNILHAGGKKKIQNKSVE